MSEKIGPIQFLVVVFIFLVMAPSFTSELKNKEAHILVRLVALFAMLLVIGGIIMALLHLEWVIK